MRKVAVGPPKAKLVSKIRRTKEQAYGTRTSWAAMRRAVLQRDNYKCRQCNRKEFLQVDHIIQVSKGGRTILPNLWTLCDTCHAKRPGHRKARALITHRSRKSR